MGEKPVAVAVAVAAGEQRARIVAYGFAACIAFGILLRFFHVDLKLYGYDESITSLRVSGHTLSEYMSAAGDGRAHSIEDLRAFQSPGRDTGVADVTHSLSTEDPQHPPLFFLVCYVVQKVAGDSLFVRRLPAVVFGILVLPAVYWLGIELFGSRLYGLCAAALVAVSPFHVIFSQDAREYSLWMLATALASALLLRGLARGGTVVWLGYAAAVSLGLWTFTLFAYVVVAHVIYAISPLSGAAWRRRTSAAAAATAGSLTFVPWLLVIVRGTGTAASDMSWSGTRLSLPLYVGKWIFNAGSVFFDLDFLSLLLVPIALAAIAIAVSYTVQTFRATPIRSSGFIAVLGVVPALAIVIPDLALHQSRAIEARYLTPLWLALELGTAYGLAKSVTAGGRRWSVLSDSAAGCLLALGIASCSVSSFARTWWITSGQQHIPAAADALSTRPNATLVYVGTPTFLLELLPSARPDLRFRLYPTALAAARSGIERAYILAGAGAVAPLLASHQIEAVPLPHIFPDGPDESVARLHRSAAADRHVGGYGLDELYVFRDAGSARS